MIYPLRIKKDKSYETFNFIKSVSDIKNKSESEIVENHLWNIFAQNRNNYSRKVKHAHNEFIKNEIEMYKKDPKKLWCILKELLNQKSSVPSAINFNGTLVDNETIICEKFNYFFVNSIKDINNNISESKIKVLNIRPLQNEIKFKSVTKSEVFNIIKNFKKNMC